MSLASLGDATADDAKAPRTWRRLTWMAAGFFHHRRHANGLALRHRAEKSVREA